MHPGIDYRTPLPVDETGQAVITIGTACAVLVLLAWAVRLWRRSGSPLPLVVLLGSGLALVNEPVVDLLGNCYHHEAGQWTLFTLYGRGMPAWGLPGYVIVYGVIALLIVGAIERGYSHRKVLGVVAATCLIQVALEFVILPLDLYSYYGRNVYEVRDMPMYWLAVNFSGTVSTAAIVFVGRHWWVGRRRLLLLLLPATTQIVCSTMVGLPVFGLLDTDVPSGVLWAGGTLTFILAGLVINAMVRWAVSAREREPAGSVFAVAVSP